MCILNQVLLRFVYCEIKRDENVNIIKSGFDRHTPPHISLETCLKDQSNHSLHVSIRLYPENFLLFEGKRRCLDQYTKRINLEKYLGKGSEDLIPYC